METSPRFSFFDWIKNAAYASQAAYGRRTAAISYAAVSCMRCARYIIALYAISAIFCASASKATFVASTSSISIWAGSFSRYD